MSKKIFKKFDIKNINIKRILIDSLITVVIFIIATAIGYLLDFYNINSLNFIILYVLGIVLTAILTHGYVYSSILSIISVLGYDFFFTVPKMTFHFHDQMYIVTFILMFIVGIIVSWITFQFKKKMAQVNDLNIEKEKLKSEAEKEQLKATILRSISHDIRTPLTTIKNGAELILENPELEEKEKTDILNDIVYKTNWTTRLVGNLLSLSRINNEHLTVKKSMEAIEEIVPEAVRTIDGTIEDRTIHYDMPEELMLVPMDATLIIQTIGNILINAVRYTESNGNIWIKVFNSNKNAVFRITNDGKPIKMADLDHIFEMYYTDMSKDSHGTGLGLPICKMFVTAHGGTITARNTDDGKVMFEFTLPMQEENNG